MSTDNRRKQLGKGLSALLGDDDEDYADLDRLRAPKTVPIELLAPSPLQPRHKMDEEDLQRLSQSVAEKGVLQPLLVRRDPNDSNMFEIVAGERRWRAAQMAGLYEVPVVVKELSDHETLEIALVENLQRENLTPLEEALGYNRLIGEFSHTQEDLAKRLGKSRSHVANMMRLLGLPEEIKSMLESGALSTGHARALLGADNAVELAQRVVKQGLNVRQTENLTKSEGKAGSKSRKVKEKDADTLALERDISNLLGLVAEIRVHRSGGSLTLHYRSLEQLDDILHRLSHSEQKPADALDDSGEATTGESDGMFGVSDHGQDWIGSDEDGTGSEEPS
ncbi:MAG: ParB/RepB/Spo0J family partition protein [Rhodospirillales bacterium]|nr:ParB/RepB/Spo0J family partition protein [Rhodospirillales bacterium]